jgi:hypothetical protein
MPNDDIKEIVIPRQPRTAKHITKTFERKYR